MHLANNIYFQRSSSLLQNYLLKKYTIINFFIDILFEMFHWSLIRNELTRSKKICKIWINRKADANQNIYYQQNYFVKTASTTSLLKMTPKVSFGS